MAKFLSVRKTLEVCRSLGWLIGKVEQPANYRRSGLQGASDLFGFADLVAIVPGKPGTLYLQVTAGGNGSVRVDKMLDFEDGVADAVQTVLNAGNYVEVWDWVVRSPRGTKRKFRDAIRWQLSTQFDELVAERVQDFSEFAVDWSKSFREIVG